MKPKCCYPLIFCVVVSVNLTSQTNIQQSTSINNNGSAPHPSAILDVQATEKGMLVPRMSSSQRMAIPVPAIGLQVFDLDMNSFYFYNGTNWVNLSSGGLVEEEITIMNGNNGSVLNITATSFGVTASYNSGIFTITIPANNQLLTAHLKITNADVQSGSDGAATDWVRVVFSGTSGNINLGNPRVPIVQKTAIPSSDPLSPINSASIDNDNNPAVSVVGMTGHSISIRVSGLSVGTQGYLLSFTGF